MRILINIVKFASIFILVVFCLSAYQNYKFVTFLESDALITGSINSTTKKDKTHTPSIFHKLPQLSLTNWRCYRKYSHMIIEGEVKNTDFIPLRNVTSLAKYYSSDGRFIKSSRAIIEYDILMPNQTSPFKTLTRINPLMAKCTIEFKAFSGGRIFHIDEKAQRKKRESSASSRYRYTGENMVKDVQSALIKLGYEIGTTDGIEGKRTRDAMRAVAEKEGWDTARGVTASLLHDLKVLNTLREQAHEDRINRIRKQLSASSCLSSALSGQNCR